VRDGLVAAATEGREDARRINRACRSRDSEEVGDSAQGAVCARDSEVLDESSEWDDRAEVEQLQAGGDAQGNIEDVGHDPHGWGLPGAENGGGVARELPGHDNRNEQPLLPPIIDEEGKLVPAPTLLHELIASHPVAYATVAPLMIIIGGALTIGLVVHCSMVLVRSVGEEQAHERQNVSLQVACVLRLIGLLPRPYAWWRVQRMIISALLEPTPLLVAHRCIRASNDVWFKMNDKLTQVYYLWIIGVVAHLLMISADERTSFEKSMLRHASACVTCVALQKVLGVAMMLLMIHYPGPKIERKMYRNSLETSSTLQWIDSRLEHELSEDPCVICFAAFEAPRPPPSDENGVTNCTASGRPIKETSGGASSAGAANGRDVVRRLNSCGHVFHRDCIDAWLLDHRPRGIHPGASTMTCPVCGTAVQPPPAHVADPVTARELAWIVELQRAR